jgi:hypothetical protein
MYIRGSFADHFEEGVEMPSLSTIEPQQFLSWKAYLVSLAPSIEKLIQKAFGADP